MPKLTQAIRKVQDEQRKSGKPLAVVLAGHNGSGKSTMWYRQLASRFQIPLINADRMMMSILPEAPGDDRLPKWASELRDSNQSWMHVAQQGVKAFVAHAMVANVPFAMETVFSHWKSRPDGSIESKIDLIHEMQEAGYYVLLIFVGLTSSDLSIARVSTRVALGGHAVPDTKLRSRFPRTQRAINAAVSVADAAILTDNSREPKHAFTVCRIQLREEEIYDRRNAKRHASTEISAWLDTVCPNYGDSQRGAT
jgi:predicted ABC-type ATPase